MTTGSFSPTLYGVDLGLLLEDEQFRRALFRLMLQNGEDPGSWEDLRPFVKAEEREGLLPTLATRIEVVEDGRVSRLGPFPTLDVLLQYGIAASQLGKLSLVKPDARVKLQNGRILVEIGDYEDPLCVGDVGVFGIEPTSYDWQKVVESLARA